MTAASAFSGAGLADEGLRRAGFEHLWFCEKVPVRRSVLRRHYPGLPICEDVKTLADDIEAGKYAAPDLFWFSPPCQDLSVAGLKEGLSGARSGLFFDGIRAVRSLRDRGTRYIIMEQVPGLLMSNSFGDLLEVLSQFAALRPVSWGYRVLDSQYFGVAQVRRRCFFVLDFGGERAGEILFEQNGCERRVEPFGEAREDLAQGAEGLPRIGCRDKAVMCFRDKASASQTMRVGDKADAVTKTHSVSVMAPDKARTCLAKGNDSYDETLQTYVSEKSKTIISNRPTRSPANAQLVATFIPGKSATCCSRNQDRNPVNATYVADTDRSNRVRRLTPVETERLFGLPNDFTRWRDDGTEIKDSPRYEMLGDGVVANVSEWLGRGVIA